MSSQQDTTEVPSQEELEKEVPTQENNEETPEETPENGANEQPEGNSEDDFEFEWEKEIPETTTKPASGDSQKEEMVTLTKAEVDRLKGIEETYSSLLSDARTHAFLKAIQAGTDVSSLFSEFAVNYDQMDEKQLFILGTQAENPGVQFTAEMLDEAYEDFEGKSAATKLIETNRKRTLLKSEQADKLKAFNPEVQREDPKKVAQQVAVVKSGFEDYARQFSAEKKFMGIHLSESDIAAMSHSLFVSTKPLFDGEKLDNERAALHAIVDNKSLLLKWLKENIKAAKLKGRAEQKKTDSNPQANGGTRVITTTGDNTYQEKVNRHIEERKKKYKD